MDPSSFQMQLADLLADYAQIDPKQNRLISGLNLDSRCITEGDLFLAKSGTKTHGAFFIKDAIERGAAAIVMDAVTEINSFEQAPVPIISIPGLFSKIGNLAARFYADPSKYLQIAGITGTSGKTSCAHFITQVMNEKKHPAAVIGTLGNGLLNNLQHTSLTTPDAITLQKLFAEFHAKKVRYVAMEVASHALNQNRVNGVNFAVAVFTNLSRDHLDYHETMENYIQAKRSLFSQPGIKYAVINADDVYGQAWITELYNKMPVYAYSINPHSIAHKLPADLPLISAREVQGGEIGITAAVHTPWGEGVLHNSNLIGSFNLSNLLVALTVSGIFGMPLEKILLRLAGIRSVNGRLQALGGHGKPLVVVDYSHKPDALQKALQVLRKQCHGRLWCVFGCGGDRDRGKRPIMGKVAEQYADHIVITDDNPRTEDPRQIVSEILQGLTEPHQAIVEHDRRRAIAHAISCAQPQDIVLVAGKGHETWQIIGEDKQPFSDSLEVQLLLAEKTS